jgi:hypothetical protein
MPATSAVFEGSEIKFPGGRGPQRINEIGIAAVKRHQAPNKKGRAPGPRRQKIQIGCGGLQRTERTRDPVPNRIVSPHRLGPRFSIFDMRRKATALPRAATIDGRPTARQQCASHDRLR